MVQSQCFPALTNGKDGRMDPRAQLEERDFHDGDKKDPQCFSLASELQPTYLQIKCQCKKNYSDHYRTEP